MKRKADVDFMETPTPDGMSAFDNTSDTVVIWQREIPKSYGDGVEKHRAVAIKGKSSNHKAVPFYIALETLSEDSMGVQRWSGSGAGLELVLIYEIAKSAGTLPAWVGEKEDETEDVLF